MATMARLFLQAAGLTNAGSGRKAASAISSPVKDCGAYEQI